MTQSEKTEMLEEVQKAIDQWKQLTPQERLRPLIEKGLVDKDLNIIEGPVKHPSKSNGQKSGH